MRLALRCNAARARPSFWCEESEELKLSNSKEPSDSCSVFSAAPANDRPEVKIPELYQIVVECSGEHEQQQVYQRMRKEGFPCRVLTL